MSGDTDKIFALWQEMIGEAEPEDLSAVWPVRLGETTELLNLAWYELKTGRSLTRHGEVVLCPAADWAAATLDGWDDMIPAPIEAKHVGGFEPRERVVERYTPQATWQMICTGARQVVLSIIEGGREPALEVVPWDETYAAELWRRAEAFMECVRNLTPPVVFAPVAAPVKAERVVDMKGSNAWAEHAGLWLKHRAGAKAFSGAEKEIKALVPEDAKRAHGHGIQAARDKAGRLSIRPAKEA